MPILRNIWKYLRNPTAEERNWLTLLEGEIRAHRIIIDDTNIGMKRRMKLRTASGVETVAKKVEK